MNDGAVPRPGNIALIASALLALALAGWAVAGYVDGLAAQRAEQRAFEVRLRLQQLDAALDDDRGIALCAAMGLRLDGPRPDLDERFRSALAGLEDRVADTPGQSTRLRDIDARWRSFAVDYLTPLRAACESPERSRGPQPGQVMALLRLGDERRRHLRGKLEAVRAAEHSRLATQRQTTRALPSGTLIVLLAAAGLALSFLVAAGWGARRAARRLRSSNDALARESAQRQRAVAGHAESEFALRSVFEHIPEAIAIVGDEGTIEAVNRTAAQLGWRVGAPADGALYLPAGAQEADGLPAEAAEAAGAADAVYLHPVARPGGSPAMHEFSRVRLPSPKRARYLFVARNVEERQRLEREKSEFLSTVSHELRTPLTSLRAALAMIADVGFAGIDPDIAKLVRLAHLNSEALARLVNDIVDMEQLSTERMSFDMQPLALAGALDEAAELAQSFAWVRDVTIRLQPVPDGAIVQADPQRFGQVLGNLLSNAIKFSPPGAEVGIVTRLGDGVARVEIIDAGPGIPADFAERIFNKFSRADDSDTRRQGGSGLGLSIARGMVERMHGRIGYENLRGGGCRFHVELPLASGHDGSVRDDPEDRGDADPG